MRGVGQTALLVASVPEGSLVVAPNDNIVKEIASRLSRERPMVTIDVASVNSETDVDSVLSGLRKPVFFDHSFFLLTERHVAKRAVELATIASRAADWTRR